MVSAFPILFIIANSGMCSGGRIVDHLKHGLEDRKNDIFFVDCKAKGTPGRKLIEKKISVKAGILPWPPIQPMPISRCSLIGCMSCPSPPREIRLVHG